MHRFDAYYQAIDEIVRVLQLDLIGPENDAEILEENPLNRYQLGILYPQAEKNADPSEQDGGDDASAEEKKEYTVGELEEIFEDSLQEMKDTVSRVNAYLPSALAVTVLLPADAGLHICFTCGRYALTADSNPAEYQTAFQRIPMQRQCTAEIPEAVRTVCVLQDEWLAISCHVRTVYPDRSRLVTVSVTNTHSSNKNRLTQSQAALFQCCLSLQSTSCFLPIRQSSGLYSASETVINEMLYREIGQFACGHGCSVSYPNAARVDTVSSTFLPRERLCQMIPAALENDEYLYMHRWKAADRNAGCDALLQFAAQYQKWRSSLEQEPLPPQYAEAAAASFRNIDLCIRRIRSGIAVLRSNDFAWESFLLMQEAMLMQRVHTKQGCKPESVKWYPFQLAYILQIIPDIADPESPFRHTADLLWFPTGGGKTEAYLGVAAFVIFFRRLSKKPESDGTAIIMRYTLRLLTIQQFERAAALICACEVLRRERGIPGGEISIGLWIGSAMTPNKLMNAAEVLETLREDQSKQIYEGNPVQVTKCPWCGAPVTLADYSVGAFMNIRCGSNPDCAFHQHMPVYLIDEDIYHRPPTLVLSTIDKFARLAWEGAAGAILGNGSPLPPELIIQDELHLISGPLGTVTGVYEAAVDEICRANGGDPKIIASTATARNAAEQIRVLYHRDMQQFPPNGLRYDDSFFAVAANEYDRPARTYLGICSSGGSAANLLIRLYALSFYLKLLLQKKGMPEQVVDQFFTTVGYFNTIKDLGTSSTIIEDRITAELRSMIRYEFREEAEQYGITLQDIKPYYAHAELTSRRSSQEIRRVLDQLSRPYTQEGCYAYVLSSNMLSVGIDIDRLGFMTVFGQPKSNAEYIQATSRVGRAAPGIVIALYHGMRSRDKSHFERFPYYHRTFYQYVEANSVTSYSARAIEKALHCAFVSMLRHMVPALNANDSACSFSGSDPAVQRVRLRLLNRAAEISPETAGFAGEWLDYFIECWEQMRRDARGNLVYYDYLGTQPSLMISAEDAENPEETPRILNTMRDVQPQSDVYIVRR